MRRTLGFAALMLIATLTDVQPAIGQSQSQSVTVGAVAVNDYSAERNWLCRPGRNDACTVDLTTTVVEPSGNFRVETYSRNLNARIDCFYVYPTVSMDSTPNSDMTAGPEETSVIAGQFARFGSECRLYAPLYRQVTLVALRAGIAGRPMSVDRVLAYNDVVGAWKYYLEHDNQGRGVVLIGHSQGTGILRELIRNEIDGKPAQKQIVSALLLGTTLPVPKGANVGGAFKHMPLCRSASQTGCVISFASFRANSPPPANTRYGHVEEEGMEAACTNPAALGGGVGELRAYLPSAARAWVTPEKRIETPFVSVPGLLTAECLLNDKGSYLAVTVNADSNDPRADDIVGDVVVAGQTQADWGLHLVDVHVTLGNLVGTVRQQAIAYLASGQNK